MLLDAIIVDFETRSACDLKLCGTDQYGVDPTTDILCMAAYDTQTDNTWLWYPSDGALPTDLVEAIEDCEYVAAHNARFDQLIWEFVAVEKYGFPELSANKWYCTAAQCRVNAAPSGLNNAALFTTGKRLKMGQGMALIKLLSIPNSDGTFTEDAAALLEMGAYCLQDTIATAAVVRHTRPMTQTEHEDWLISERINDNGVKVDVELAERAQDYAKDETIDISAKLLEKTGGVVKSITQNQRIKKWVIDHVEDEVVLRYLTKTTEDKTTGKITHKTTFDKSARAKLKQAVLSGGATVSAEVFDVLEATDAGSKSSVAKFARMVAMADIDDDRVRGAYMYAGASQTKRFSSKGLQVHNFKRDSLSDDDVEQAKALMGGHALHLMVDEKGLDIMELLSRMLRPALIPERGHSFIVSDWAAIEGRCLPWLAGCAGGEKVLDIFRKGEDIYMHTAKSMNIADRQIGKVATLALGFQGGVNAFNLMARNYGVNLPETTIQHIVTAWRHANSWAPNFWAGLERAGKKAINRPNTEQKCGRITYYFSPDILGGTLLAMLPDDTVLQYPYARIEEVDMPWGGTQAGITFAKSGINPAVGDAEWPRSTLYGGLMCENVTQAIAASLLRQALREAAEAGLKVVLHVHDEIVIETKIENIAGEIGVLQAIMENPPSWADGLPLSAVPEVKTRYGK